MRRAARAKKIKCFQYAFAAKRRAGLWPAIKYGARSGLRLATKRDFDFKKWVLAGFKSFRFLKALNFIARKRKAKNQITTIHISKKTHYRRPRVQPLLFSFFLKKKAEALPPPTVLLKSQARIALSATKICTL